jgi:large subunit ribosomal protein L31
MIKKNIHPKWYKAKVYCEGKIIFEVGSTKPQINTNIWANNHPFFINFNTNKNDIEQKVENFENKYFFNEKKN